MVPCGSGAISDGEIPIDVFVCAMAGSLCNIENHSFAGTTDVVL